MSYYRRRILVRGYTRKKPKTRYVKPYYRNQRYSGKVKTSKIPRRKAVKPITPLPTKEDKKVEEVQKWLKVNILTEDQWKDFKYGNKTYLSYLNEGLDDLFQKRKQATSEGKRNQIWEREKALKKIRDDYSSNLFEEQKKQIKKKEAKEQKGRSLLMTKRFNFFKDWEINDEKPISDINKEFYGIMNMGRTVIMYPTSNVEKAPFHKATIEKKVAFNTDPDKFYLSSGGGKWIVNPHKPPEKNEETHFFDLEKVQKFSTKLDKGSLKAYHGVNSPLIIQDKDVSFALAPRVSDSKPFYENDILITKEKYKTVSKMTKKVLFEKTGISKKQTGKDALVFAYIRNEITEKRTKKK